MCVMFGIWLLLWEYVDDFEDFVDFDGDDVDIVEVVCQDFFDGYYDEVFLCFDDGLLVWLLVEVLQDDIVMILEVFVGWGFGRCGCCKDI